MGDNLRLKCNAVEKEEREIAAYPNRLAARVLFQTPRRQCVNGNFVLRTFKKLHRTRMATFQGDDHALQVTRNKLNEEYKKYKNVTNPAAIEELNKFAEEVEHELRTTVIQAVETKPGTFELRLTPDKLIDSVPYKDEECHSSNKNADLSTSTSKDKPK